MKAFNKGDAVKLTTRFATVLNARPKNHADWLKRTGVVRSINNYNVLVIWDGVNTQETLPIKAVELIA